MNTIQQLTDEEILEEDRRRRSNDNEYYDPITGHESPERVLQRTPVPGLDHAWIPRLMTEDTGYESVRNDAYGWERLRCRYDFEFWAARCAVIPLKARHARGPFILNRPQRKVLAILEGMRLKGKPIRMIILKARQWGASTLVQMYMAWIQTCLLTNWNSVIIAHVKDTAASIRGMYTEMLASYPEELWTGDEKPCFKPYERSVNIRLISGRDCRVTVGSAENQEAVRGADFSMAHLSEAAFWKDTPSGSPEDVVRAVCGSVPLTPLSLVVMESTANGVGNFFHREWLRSVAGESDKVPVFIPWYLIEIYRTAPPDPVAFARSMNKYEQSLWNNFGLSLDRIYWYHRKRTEYPTDAAMRAEYPTTAVEAFANTADEVFPSDQVEAMRCYCANAAESGIMEDDTFCHHPDGPMLIWKQPQPDCEYIIGVDVGGRAASSDYSVAVVMTVPFKGEAPEVVAQWRGHTDHDILAKTAVGIGHYYNNAFLVVESNSLENGAGGEDNLLVLRYLADNYSNLYMRRSYDSLSMTEETKVGFQTNRSTKKLIVDTLIRYVREQSYIERHSEALDEFLTYCRFPSGSFGARKGCHDDMLMARGLALTVLETLPPMTVGPNPPDAVAW